MRISTENLFLEVASGLDMGKAIKIQEGLQIGRTKGEFIVADPRVSALHAEVTKHKKGIFVLVDQGSTHKILFNGKKVNRVALLPGIEFFLGNTKFRVYQKNTLDKHYIEHEKALRPHHYLIDQTQKYFTNNAPLEMESILQFFPYPLELEWIQGLEYGRKEWISFGPRKIGSQGIDLKLLESLAPPNSFELSSPKESSNIILFTTEYPQIVLINQQSVNKKIIENYDVIEIGLTKIKITFVQDYLERNKI